jgi:HrpA-like RNA helicase
MSVAKRVSEEYGCRLGQEVWFMIRPEYTWNICRITLSNQQSIHVQDNLWSDILIQQPLSN